MGKKTKGKRNVACALTLPLQVHAPSQNGQITANNQALLSFATVPMGYCPDCHKASDS
jgi:hypothetical protein